MTNWLVTLCGAALALLALRDVFHTLWHPTRHGGLSRRVMTIAWHLSAGFGRRRAVGLAGPLGMVTVVVLWAVTVIVGWALMYWPHLPAGFSFAAGLTPTEHSGFLDAVYISIVTMATLGLGDIAPADGWLRILGPLEAVVGFALLTATVTWVLGIFPALARRRAVALRISQLRRADMSERALSPPHAATMLQGLISDLAHVCVDFRQYTESYYFHDGDENTSLAANIMYLASLAERLPDAAGPDTSLARELLGVSLHDLAVTLDERFLHTGGSTWQVLTRYAQDHGRAAKG
ncbi:potassium channel family protein [Streptomyces agglomeratus]|uniref:potassium channel family protein n=1 Tax=Streptomyces agglomeratus TaxID=285458 RepID=UPI0008547917|nr:potassium channel family protein [Streptomyces agglomeratus]OEJ49571.1 Ion transport 2 domain protein [Streptomyces agglomeratus]